MFAKRCLISTRSSTLIAANIAAWKKKVLYVMSQLAYSCTQMKELSRCKSVLRFSLTCHCSCRLRYPSLLHPLLLHRSGLRLANLGGSILPVRTRSRLRYYSLTLSWLPLNLRRPGLDGSINGLTLALPLAVVPCPGLSASSCPPCGEEADGCCTCPWACC